MGTLKHSFNRLLHCAGVILYHLGFARWVIARSGRTRATLYHSVENPGNSYTEGLCPNVCPGIFALHLDYYQRYYRVCSMSEFLRHDAAGGAARDAAARPLLLVTFDDGYASVKDNALPLLEARAMPATMYLIGNALRGRTVWVNRVNQALNVYPAQAREVLDAYPGIARLDRLAVIHKIQTTFKPAQISHLVQQLEMTIPGLTNEKEKLFCTPDDVRQMQKRGMEFGFHTNDHWNLEQCKDSELAATLDTRGLEDLIDSKTFAYPFGYFAPSAIGRLSRLGYAKLMTVGSNNDRFSELHLDRTEVFETSFASLFARLEVVEPVNAAVRTWVHRWRTQATELMGRGNKRTV